MEIIKKFAAGDSTIKFLKNEKNMGVLHNGNRLLNMATGDYIFWAASDDKVLPGFFEKSMNLLAQYPQAGMCFSDPSILDNTTGLISDAPLSLTDTPYYFSPDEIVAVIRKRFFSIDSHTAIVSRWALLETGGYIPGLKWCSDWFMVHLLAFRHGACYVPETLTTFRIFPDSYYFAGARNQPQREVISHIIDLLNKPEFRDVFPLFWQSGVMASFKLDILRVISAKHEYLKFLSPSLIFKSLRCSIIDILLPITPLFIKKVYRSIAVKKVNNR